MVENEVSTPVKKKPGIVYNDSEEKFVKRIEVYCDGFNASSIDPQNVKLYYDKEFTIPVKAKDFSDILVNGILRIVIDGAEVELGVRFNTLMKHAGENVLMGLIMNGPGVDIPIIAMEGDDPPEPLDWDTYKLEPAIGALNGEFRFWFKESDLTYVDGTGLVWEHQLSAEDSASLYNLLQTGRSYGTPELTYNSDDRSSNACYCKSSAKQGSQYDTSETGHIKIKKSSNYYLDFNNDGNSLMLIIPSATVENFSTGDVAFINHQAVFYES